MENENGNQNQQTTEVNNEGVGNAVTQTGEKNEGGAEKTFTQEEVNSFLKKEKDKLLKDVPTKEELKAYKEWKESQKTAEQKQNEKETEYQKTISENTALINENKVLKSGVSTDDVDYVVFKVSKMEGDFEDNLETFLKENPKYLNNAGEQKAPTTNGVQVQRNNTSKDDGVRSILKAKHPGIYD